MRLSMITFQTSIIRRYTEGNLCVCVIEWQGVALWLQSSQPHKYMYPSGYVDMKFDYIYRYIFSKLQTDYWSWFFTENPGMERGQDKSAALVSDDLYHDLCDTLLSSCVVVGHAVISTRRQLKLLSCHIVIYNIGTLPDMKDLVAWQESITNMRKYHYHVVLCWPFILLCPLPPPFFLYSTHVVFAE